MDLSSIAHVKFGRKCAEKPEVVGCTKRQTWALKCLSGGASLSSWVFCFTSVLNTFTNHRLILYPTPKMKNRPLSRTILLMLKKVLYKNHVQNIIDLFNGAAILPMKNPVILLKLIDENITFFLLLVFLELSVQIMNRRCFRASTLNLVTFYVIILHYNIILCLLFISSCL